MPRISIALRLFLVLLAALALGPGLGAPAGAASPTVVLISLDGTRPADLDADGLEVFAALTARGTRAARLAPVFPTNTFPNHVSLVTGVPPAVHGIVNNTFEDPERGRFSYGSDPTWIEVEPLWSILSARGIVSASFHWVGSEGAWRSGRGPRYWKPFDSGVSESAKVDQILAWLALPDGARPQLVTAWFHGADAAAHRSGPGSAAALAALGRQAPALERLLAGLDGRDGFEDTTLLLVSDHGMAAVARQVDLGAALDARGLRASVLGAGGSASVLVAGDPTPVVAAARELDLEAWVRGEAPAELGLLHPRFGDVFVLAPLGTAIASSRSARSPMRGAHGYRARLPEMGGIFLAVGRGFAPGGHLGEVSVLDVAPTVLSLLGVPVPARMEGRPLASPVQGDTVKGP